MIEEVRIVIKGDAKEIESTVAQLEKLGKVDRANAEQFKKNNDSYNEGAKKQRGLLEDLRSEEGKLIQLREQATDTEQIKKYNQQLADNKTAQQNLTGEVINTHKATEHYHGAVSNLVRGLGGLSGLIATISKALGVEAQELVELALASHEFIKLSREMQNVKHGEVEVEHDINKVRNESIGVTEAETLATGKSTEAHQVAKVATEELTEAEELSIPVVGILVGVIGAVAGAMFYFASKSYDAKDALKDLGEQIAGIGKDTGSLLADALGDKLDTITGQIVDAQLALQNAEELLKKDLNKTDREKAEKDREEVNQKILSLMREQKATEIKLQVETENEKTKEVAKGSNDKIKIRLAELEALKQANLKEFDNIIYSEDEKEKTNINSDKKDFESAEERNVRLSFIDKKYKEQIAALNKQMAENDEKDDKERKKKEYDRQQEALRKLLALWEKYQIDLDRIQLQIRDTQERDVISTIRDATAKKLREEDLSFDKEKEQMDKQRKELEEIVKKGSDKEQMQAMDLLGKLNKAEEVALKSHKTRLEIIIEEANAKELEEEKKKAKELLELQIKESDQQTTAEKISAKKRLVEKKITEEQYQVEVDRLELGGMERKLQLEQDAGMQDVDLQQKIEEQKLKIIEDSNKARESLQKKAMENIKVFVDSTLSAVQKSIEDTIAQIDHLKTIQQANIDTQRALAISGKQNDLAFEIAQQDKLEKQRMIEQKKLKKAKELEIFLNAVANFSKDAKNPGEAITKAVTELALVKAVESSYGEKGGLLGQTTERSTVTVLGASKTHPGGDDIFLHAQKGEGLLSRGEVAALGGADGFLMLKAALAMPMNHRKIPLTAVPGNQNFINKELMGKIDKLNKTIEDKPNIAIDFDGLGNMIVTQTEKGIKEATTYILKKARIKS